MTSFANYTQSAVHGRRNLVFITIDVGQILYSRSTVQLERLVHFLNSADFTQYGDFFNLTRRSYAVFVSQPENASILEQVIRTFCKTVEGGGALSLPVGVYHLPRDRQPFLSFIEKIQSTPEYPRLTDTESQDARFKEMGEWMRIANQIHQIDIDNFVIETPIWRIVPPNPLGFETVACELTIGIKELARAIDRPQLALDPSMLNATTPLLDERLFSHICKEPSHQKGTIHLNVVPMNLSGQVFSIFLERLPPYLRPTYSFELEHAFFRQDRAHFIHLATMLRNLSFKVTLDKVPFADLEDLLVTSDVVNTVKVTYDNVIETNTAAAADKVTAFRSRHPEIQVVLLYPETPNQVVAGLRAGFEFVEGHGVAALRIAIKEESEDFGGFFSI